MKRWLPASLALMMSLLLLACERRDQPSPVTNTAPGGNQNRAAEAKPDASSSESPTADTFTGTAAATKKEFPNRGVVTLQAMRAATSPAYDRVVFEFQGGAIPSYHIEYVDKPVRQCGSGDAVQIAGDGWLLVKFTPAQAHTEAGQPTITPREQRFTFPILKEIEFVCDFEAEVAAALGVASPNPYRVLELQNPSRLVIDIKR